MTVIADPSGAAAHVIEPELVGRDGRPVAYGEHAHAEQAEGTEELRDEAGGPPRAGP
jgi:hypothetical protein